MISNNYLEKRVITVRKYNMSPLVLLSLCLEFGTTYMKNNL